MTEHWVFSDQSTYLWEVIFSFPTYWKCFKASLESNSMKNKMVYTTKPNYKYESMKTKWSTHDIVFQCQDVLVMYDIKVYCGSLQQKLTRFDFLSGMTFGSFSIDYYRLWITRRQENYFRNKQRGRYGPTLTEPNYTDHSKWNVHFVLSISRPNSAMKDTEKKTA